ncbi:hypothetical protein ACOQFV_08365 [Nocardiopsis changdeensis]|uniref:Integral membrane protein n=1 Tax=Nocardiopsis changdeensis TaxID=2831969 RepID=A0ABX8BDV7_9ACTN|nr:MULTISPECIES: hypothetical protein [Nocardiopsis]QUX20431.1 hypothetical protein KGD84_18115 [Nocardiopsis changdeensis]QYX36361.1 hypothetical protein K1J57_27570 [Nocardiopsis sp. MT53]
MTTRTAPATASATWPLRLLLGTDAATCLAAGALLTAASPWLPGLLALPAALLVPAGVFLLGFGAWLALLASGRGLTRAAVRAAIAVNAVWVVATGALGLGVLVDPNGFGTAFLLVQAAAVAGLAALEAVALGRADLA